jgi:hypothetical protein
VDKKSDTGSKMAIEEQDNTPSKEAKNKQKEHNEHREAELNKWKLMQKKKKSSSPLKRTRPNSYAYGR